MTQSKSLLILSRTSLCLISILFVYFIWSDFKKIERIKTEKKTETMAIDSDAVASVKLNTKRIIPDNSDFDEIVKRPLFNDDRLPFVYVAPKKTDPNSKKTKQKKAVEQYRLNAVVITPEKQIAIIQSGKNKELHRVSLGESIDDWVLSEVTSHSIQMEKGKQTKTLELEIKISAKKPATKKKMNTQQKAALNDKNAEIGSLKSLKEKIAQAKKDAAVGKK